MKTCKQLEQEKEAILTSIGTKAEMEFKSLRRHRFGILNRCGSKF